MKFNPEPKRVDVYVWAILPDATYPEPVYVYRVRGRMFVDTVFSKGIDGRTVTYGDELVAPEVTP